MSYRLLTFQTEIGPRAGLLINHQVHDLARISGEERWSTVLGVLADWIKIEPLLERLAEQHRDTPGTPIDATTLLAPILYPPTVYCAGANYFDHVENMQRRLGLPDAPDPRANGGKPFHFLKASRCCVGTAASVRSPSPKLDWEGELVVVIGQEGRDVPIDRAMVLVAGYMVGNDLSARDIAFKSNFPQPSIFNHSFLEHKSFEHAAPVGPWITPASYVDDIAGLMIRTTVNGTLKQNGACGGMIFSIAEQLSYLSSISILLPGDIVMTGTPAGVGMETGEFLGRGDVVMVEIDGLGSLTTPIV